MPSLLASVNRLFLFSSLIFQNPKNARLMTLSAFLRGCFFGCDRAASSFEEAWVVAIINNGDFAGPLQSEKPPLQESGKSGFNKGHDESIQTLAASSLTSGSPSLACSSSQQQDNSTRHVSLHSPEGSHHGLMTPPVLPRLPCQSSPRPLVPTHLGAAPAAAAAGPQREEASWT